MGTAAITRGMFIAVLAAVKGTEAIATVVSSAALAVSFPIERTSPAMSTGVRARFIVAPTVFFAAFKGNFTTFRARFLYFDIVPLISSVY